MKIDKILTTIDEIRPNNISEETKLSWMDTLEKSIAEHMTRYSEISLPTPAPTANSDALLGSEYLYMYAYYGVAMIDFINQDIAMYNNSSTYFNSMFENWQKKWRREHLPFVIKGGEA